MKLPKQAKKVFTGEIFDVYQWPQKMFDGSTITFEMLKRQNTTQIIPTVGNKIIIAQDKQPARPTILTLLGGRIETDETPAKSAKRELLEEGGFTSQNWKLYKTFWPQLKIDWKIYYFVARNCQKIQEQNLDPGEKIKLIAVNFTDWVDLMISGKMRGGDFALHIAQLKIRNRLDELRTLLFKK